MLVRLVRTFPNASFAPSAREALRQSLTADNIAQEAMYLRAEGRASFERPYGLAWLLQLVAELREWDDPQAREMAANLRPVEQAALAVRGDGVGSALVGGPLARAPRASPGWVVTSFTRSPQAHASHAHSPALGAAPCRLVRQALPSARQDLRPGLPAVRCGSVVAAGTPRARWPSGNGPN